MTVEEFTQEWLSDSTEVEAHTSGSTGAPKLVKLLKTDMEVSARATNERFGINSRSRLMLPLSVDFIAGKMMVVRARMAGCELVTVEPSNRFHVSDGDFDLVAIVPSQVPWLISNPTWAKRMRNVIVGGASLSESMRSELVEAGYNAFSTYGMTETCSHVALMSLAAADGIYHAVPGVEFGVDYRSCLKIMAPAYSFKTLVTNDIVELLDNRSFLWRGRYDNVINSAGLKLLPEELERIYAQYIDVPFLVARAEHEFWGECAALVVECSPSEGERYMEILRQHIDHRRVPKIVREVDHLPLTANGKPVRRL